MTSAASGDREAGAGAQTPRPEDGVRQAELLAALSLATDLGAAWPAETALRTCLVAMGLARRVGLDADAAAEVYFLALLRSVACTSFAHETARAWVDDITIRRLLDPADKATPADLVRTGATLARGPDPVRGIRAAAHLLSPFGKRLADEMCLAHRDVGRRFAERLALPATVGEGLGMVYERWDGKGMPGPLTGDEIPLANRVVHVAYVAEAKLREGGPAAAVETVRERSGGHFDPAAAATFLEGAGELLAPLAAGSVWEEALEAEPEPRRLLPASRLPQLLEAFADFADLKSPWTLGHSQGVAELAAAAGEAAGLPEPSVRTLREAGLVHDLGRVSVSNAVWDKPGPLTVAEWERVRLHAYRSERVLAATPLLAPHAQLAGLHHERLDGSGYHRGASAAALSPEARLLATADCYRALTEPRPHRPALEPDAARRELSAEAEANRLDPWAIDSVLLASGQAPARPRPPRPAGLTEREIQVLLLIARGAMAKQVARRLGISVRTANHHIEHIYGKVGVSTRAGVALFAVEHDLIGP
jgi:HD-GYP domain-containing protein (c-di-GMP phosphodiesterase class II)